MKIRGQSWLILRIIHEGNLSIFGLSDLSHMKLVGAALPLRLLQKADHVADLNLWIVRVLHRLGVLSHSFLLLLLLFRLFLVSVYVPRRLLDFLSWLGWLSFIFALRRLVCVSLTG